MRLGTVVLSASYRPAALAAKMTSILDVISDGRLVLGLGTGSDRPEHEAYGLAFASPSARTEALERALDVIQALWGERDGATVAGLVAAPCRPKPVQCPSPPILLAAHGPRLLRLAGERADGVIAAFVEPAELARRLEVAGQAYTREARAGGFDAAIYTYVLPLVQETDDWISAEAKELGTTPAGLRRWLSTTGIVAPPDELRDRVLAYRAAGATDAILVLPNRVPDEAIVALAEAVLERPDRPVMVSSPDVTGQKNLVHRLVGVHRADGRGGDLAVIDGDRQWSFDDLWESSARASGTFAAAGVRRGERVVIALRDGTDWLAAVLGAAGLGAVAVPIDPMADAARLAEILADAEPTAVVVPDGSAIPTGPWRVLDPSSLADGSPRPPIAVHEGDLAYLVYSSGSTGRPKGAMHAHGDLGAGIETYAAEVLELGRDDRCHSAARLFTSLGFGNGFFRPLGRGAAIVLSATLPTVRSVLHTVARDRVTVLTGVPTFWAQLADFATRHPVGDDLESVRLAVSSGESLPAPIGARIRETLGLDLIEGLGCSECSNILISTRPGRPTPGQLGQVVSGIDIRLADPDGLPVADGEPGRLWIRSSSNTSGYWRRPDLTRDLVHGEWLRMGDVLVAEQGVYRHVGRVDDLFKVDGLWISPNEIEAALHEHPDVVDVAVIGLPDDRGLLRPVAVVVRRAASTVEAHDLRRHVVGRLDGRRAPSRIEFVADLPRLSSGKVDRRGLRESLAGALERGSATDLAADGMMDR